MSHTWVPVASVVVDDRRKRDLGDLESLAKSIRKHGLMNPIVLTRKNRLISGWRRLEAVRQLGKKNIETHYIDDIFQAVELIDQEGTNPAHFKEMNWSERMALAMVLEDLDQERSEAIKRNSGLLAAQRRFGKDYNAAPPDNRPFTAQVIATMLGCGLSLYRAAREVYIAACDLTSDDKTRELGQRALYYMDQGGTPNGAKALLRGQARYLPSENEVPNATAGEQRNVFAGLGPVLSAVTHSLRGIQEIHPDLKRDEAARWLDDLVLQRRETERVIRKLRRFVNDG